MRKPSYASSSSSFLRCIQGKRIFVTVPQMLTASLLHFCLPKKNHHNFNLCFSAFSSTGIPFPEPCSPQKRRIKGHHFRLPSALQTSTREREEGPFPNHHRQREIVEELFKHSRGGPLSLWPAEEGGRYAAKGPHPTPPPSFGLTDTHRRRTEDGRGRVPFSGKRRARLRLLRRSVGRSREEETLAALPLLLLLSARIQPFLFFGKGGKRRGDSFVPLALNGRP